MEGGAPAPSQAGALAEQLRWLRQVGEVLLARRRAAGSIDFDLPSAEILLGDGARPVDIVEAPRTIAHRAIEEAMLAANRAVAEALDAAGLPAIHRNHEPPLPEDLEALRELLAGLAPPAGAGPRAGEIAGAAPRRGAAEERLIHQVALRSMRQVYEVEVATSRSPSALRALHLAGSVARRPHGPPRGEDLIAAARRRIGALRRRPAFSWRSVAMERSAQMVDTRMRLMTAHVGSSTRAP
jgi:ribonuclease R